MTNRPTAEEACTYAKGLFASFDPEVFVWDVRPYDEHEDAVDVELFVKGEGYGFIVVTCWYAEDNQVYGEW